MARIRVLKNKQPPHRIAGTILLPGQNVRWIFVVRKRASVYISTYRQGADVQTGAFLRTTNIQRAIQPGSLNINARRGQT